MFTLADVLRRHGPAYVERHGASMLPSHAPAVQAIVHCRTPAMGGHVAVCAQCENWHLVYHSCRHRACPQCGHDATTRWIERQRELLLPVPYFHVVFTLPAELRRLVRSHQKTLLPVLFKAAFESLAELCADPHYLGARIGALAVLHTWTRTLEWHPHVHMLVPGGGLASDGQTWIPAPRRRTRYLVPARALAKRFRGRFLHLARRALPGVSFPDIPWGKRWVVFAKPVAQGAGKVLDYLGRYVHRTAIADKAIVGCDDRTVTFRYRDSRTNEHKTMSLPGQEFVRRFLQHVPPKGLHRVRAFGLLHPAHRDTLRQLQLLLAPRGEGGSEDVPRERRARSSVRCPQCGSTEVRLVRRVSPEECLEMVRAAERTGNAEARAPPAGVAVG